MRLYLDQTHRFPEASPDWIDSAFDGFDAFTDAYAAEIEAQRVLGDLDLAADLGAKSLTFNCFVDTEPGPTELHRFASAAWSLQTIASLYLAEFGLDVPHEVRTDIASEDQSMHCTHQATGTQVRR